MTINGHLHDISVGVTALETARGHSYRADGTLKTQQVDKRRATKSVAGVSPVIYGV